MKLNKSFMLHNTGEDSILVPVGGSEFSGVVRGNKTVGAMLELLKEGTTEAAMVDALKSRFKAPEGMVEEDVSRILAELRSIGAIDD
jgi:hypothetical protein